MSQDKASFHSPDAYIHLHLDIQQTSQFSMSKTKLLITPKTCSKLTFPISLHCNSFCPPAKSKRIFPTHLISNPSKNHISSKYKINPVSHHFSYIPSLLQPRCSHHCLFPEFLPQSSKNKKISQFILIPL